MSKGEIMDKKPAKKRGFSRLWAAFFYSLGGFRVAFREEAAFRQELLLFIPLSLGVFFLPLSGSFKALLLAVNLLVLVTELLNSAIEAVVDLVSPEYHLLAKHAKDMGSAAVLLSILLAGLVWALAIHSLISF